MANKINFKEARIQFSFKREVLFIVAGGIMGAIVIAIPFTLPFTGRGSGYAHTWIEFGHIVGVFTPISSAIIAGILIHIVTGISIGIVAGIFLYKTNILNISKPSNGLRYGLFVGALVYLIFSIPVDDFVLNPGSQSMLSKNKLHEGMEYNMTAPTFSNLQLNRTIYSILNHLIFGIILGLFSSLLSIKLGARYRCPSCDISFSRIDTLQSHLGLVHSDKPINRQKIVILGGGFAGVTVLKRLQSKFQSNISIEIIMVSKDNYLLFTPMLHEVASGTIETRHIVTPIREFCNRSRFYCAIVEDIDLKNKTVMIRPSATIVPSAIMDTNTSMAELNVLQLDSKDTKSVQYDYLVISLGSETKFFGMSDIQKNAFTIKNLNDAIKLRNHIISLLEQSDQSGSNTDTIINSSVGNDNTYKNLQKRLLTFVVSQVS